MLLFAEYLFCVRQYDKYFKFNFYKGFAIQVYLFLFYIEKLLRLVWQVEEDRFQYELEVRRQKVVYLGIKKKRGRKNLSK